MPSGIYIRTEETKNKMSKSHKGIKLLEEHKKNISRSLVGNIYTKGKPWSEARRKAQPPKKMSKYNGGVYPENWHEIRKQIYARDLWICQECGNHCHNGSRINAHHIDYDISNNDLSNLITLCASCHMKTNFKRKDWIQYFLEKNRHPSIVEESIKINTDTPLKNP